MKLRGYLELDIMPITQKDIARELDISDSLVSKVLNSKKNVWASSELCERIRSTAREMGYRPNAAAQALVNGRANMVAIWSVYLDLPEYGRYVARLQAHAYAAGIQVLIRDAVQQTGEWNWPADGIFCIDAPERIREYRESSPGASIPIVSLGVLECEDADQVLMDLGIGASQAMRDMIERGCRRIAYLLPKNVLDSPDDERWQVYHREMADLEADPELIVANGMSDLAAYDAVHAYVRKHGSPEGLLVFGSFMLNGALRAFHELGTRVPDDLAVVCMDDSPELPFLQPSVSAVSMPVERLAAEAWRLLRYRQENAAAPWQRVVLPTRLIRRESTAR